MAKIVCEYDSDNGYAKFTINGRELDNVQSFSCCVRPEGYDYYGYDDDDDEDEYYIDLCQVTKDPSTGLKVRMTTCASESKKGQKALADGGKPNFLIAKYVTFPEKSPVLEEIEKYFK